MFEVNDRVIIKEYPTSEFIGKGGIVSGLSKGLFVEVVLDDRTAPMFFKERELDKVEN